MSNRQEVEKATTACVQNAEELLNAAKEVAKQGSNHIAFHLIALSLEEIGKSSMILMSSLHIASEKKEDRKQPVDWIDDHERKLFWAIWSVSPNSQVPGLGIKQALETASYIHKTRLETLYVSPSDPEARKRISGQKIQELLKLTAERLQLEKEIRPRDLTEDEKSDLNWFFVASNDPQLRLMIYSKASLEKQREFEGDTRGWIRWLRATTEEANRLNLEMAREEMNRVPPSGDGGNEDKWEIKIRLRSWSHSIRPKPLNEWNRKVDKFKFFNTKDKNELIAAIIVPKRVHIQMLWPAGMQSSYLLVIALNIGTGGFFWWYLPVFVSRFAESVVDLEQNASVQIDRVPELKLSWGNSALRTEDLGVVSLVFTHLAQITDERRRAPYTRYFKALALTAKNDIFFQFEPNALLEFHLVLKEALMAYGDWDGHPDTLDQAIDTSFSPLSGGADIIDNFKHLVQVASRIGPDEIQTEPITLEDVAKLKLACDLYFRLKAQSAMQSQVAAAKQG